MTAIQLMKRGNAVGILRLLREAPCSRADLARQMGLTRAAVTGIVDELIAAGLVREGESAKTAKGRRPIMLELAPDACCTVGVDISRQGTSLCLLDFTMRPIWELSPDAALSREEVLDRIAAAVREASAHRRVLGVGVVAPGPVYCAAGRISHPAGLEKWHGFSVSELETRLALPVVLKKDTSALAIAEKAQFGSGASFLVLLADHGLGGGYVYNGRLFEPAAGLGCELGHVSIDAGGPLCGCGNRGCAELYASVPATLARARTQGRDVSWEELISLASEGDSVALQALDEQARALSAVCVDAVNMLEPACIVLEGKLCAAYPFLKEKIECALHSRCFTEQGRTVCVRESALPRNARAFSAANLILESFFEDKTYDYFGKL